MSIIHKPHHFVAGQAAVASQVNDNFTTLYTAVNGQLDASNIKTNQWLDTKTFYCSSTTGTVKKYFIFRNGSHGGNGIIKEMGIAFSSHSGGSLNAGTTVSLDLYRITDASTMPADGMSKLNTAVLTATALNTAVTSTSFNSMLTSNTSFCFRLTPASSGGSDFNGEDISFWITYAGTIFAPT